MTRAARIASRETLRRFERVREGGRGGRQLLDYGGRQVIDLDADHFPLKGPSCFADGFG
jgi:hypothetical protein